jgi:ABC-type sugar transport system ATPase subunit
MLPIRAESLCISRNAQSLFHEFSFDTKEHRRIGIMGSTGAGKTTLLKMLAGFIQPESGKIWVGEDRVFGPNEQLIAGHKWIGYLSQHYELRNNYFVKELLDMANKLSPERMEVVIDLCHIRHLLQRRTDALSGGERQRIALARVLLTDPKWLLLDEPYSNLDLNQKRMIMQLIDDAGEKLRLSMIMVSHDSADMLSWADHLIIIDQGSILQQGKPKELYDHPLNEHVAGLLGEYNKCDAALVQQLTNTSSDLAHGKKYIIRPEHMLISAEGKGVEAVIEEVCFKGSYSIIKCRLKDQEGSIDVTVYPSQPLQIGQVLHLSTLLSYIVVMD